MSVEQVYESAVRDLPEVEQRRLASYILRKCSEMSPAQFSTEWSDEDMRDVTAYSMAIFDAREADEETQ